MRIKEIRKARNIQQKVLANELGIRQNTLSQYETGVREPDLEMLCKIANKLDVSVGYLLGQEEEQKEPTPAAGDGLSPLDQRLNELLAAADGKTKQAMIAFLEQFQKP